MVANSHSGCLTSDGANVVPISSNLTIEGRWHACLSGADDSYAEYIEGTLMIGYIKHGYSDLF